jgi:TonB family protein
MTTTEPRSVPSARRSGSSAAPQDAVDLTALIGEPIAIRSMTANHLHGALNLLGQTSVPLVSPRLASGLEPRLGVAWGDFHQGVGSSIRALFTRGSAKGFLSAGYFKDCWVERRVPKRALVAAALWHVAFIAMPFPQGAFAPKKVTGMENFQLTWSGPIQDLPLLEIPKQRAKPAPHSAPNVPLPETGADAFHPRQRIFTDPVRPTHLKQTLINPKAPMEAPKLVPKLPNMVRVEQTVPAKPRLLISEDALRKLHPRERKVKTVTMTPLDAPLMEQHVAADLSLPVTPNGPARPKLEMNAGAVPRVAKREQPGDAGPAPEVGASPLSAANGGPSTLIALSATPGPPAPVAPPAGNLAARVSISPDGATKGGSEAAGAGGKSPVGISISGGNPPAKGGISGLSAGMGSPSLRVLSARQHDSAVDDVPERVGPPDFKTLAPGAKPEQIFSNKRVYTMNVNMPNLNSATGSWILNFAELYRASSGPHVASTDLAGPVPIRKVDPKYPPTLIADRVEGEVVLYAVIGKDGSVEEIQLVRGIDDQLDANAKEALAQWKFRPGAKAGEPVELEAIVHIPFRVPPRE